MKFTVSKSAFLAALTSLKPIVKPSTTHAILGNVAIISEGKTLTLIGMDLEKKKSVAIPCRSIEDGSTAIKLAPLHAYLSTRPEPDCEVSLTITKQKETNVVSHVTTIKCGRSKNVMPGLPIEEMPPFPSIIGKPLSLAIPAALLNECLLKSLVQCAVEDTRGYLKSVMFVARKGLLNIQATNGQRLIIFYTPIEFKTDSVFIIPRESIASLANLETSGEIAIELGDNIISASAENCQFSTKLIEANVQNFENVFPPKDKISISVTAKREELLNEIESAETQTSDESRNISLDCNGPKITIKSVGRDIGNVESIMDAKDGSGKIAFSVNPLFLKDALKAFDDEEITLQFMDAITPFVIRNDSRVSVVYPMRLETAK